MNTDLILKTEDVNLFMQLTQIDGNIDFDKMRPAILNAQWNDIERILTTPLYNKIIEDIKNEALEGLYLEMYNEHILKMLIYYASSQFIQMNSITVNNGGNFQHTANNASLVSSKEIDRIVKKYRENGADAEMKFEKFIKNNPVPEYQKSCSTPKSNYKFPWQI